MVKVKICGITNKEDALLCAGLGADAIGAVVEVPVESPRKITVEKAKEVFSSVPVFVSTVSVIMPRNIGDVIRIAGELSPDVIQLQGFESIDFVSEIRKSLGVRIIKVVHVEERKPGESDEKRLNEVITEINDYASVGVCAVVLDTKTKTGIGGTGRVHDWELSGLLGKSIKVPLILAGGLNPGNVKEAVEAVNPYAVDVSSGVESHTGKKDELKVRDFLRNAKIRSFQDKI